MSVRTSILAIAVCLPLALSGCGKKLGDEAAEVSAKDTATAVDVSGTPAPAPAAEPVAPPPPIDKPLEIGSQAAKDDLYCAGVILAAHPQQLEDVVPVEAANLMNAQNQALALSIAGTGKMIDEKVVLAPQAGAVSDAWADVAIRDFAAKKPRIKLDECTKRAEAVLNAPQ